MRCLLSEGYGSVALRRAGPFDLILANILADPLCAMARDTARNLAPDGTAVLSGILDRQAYRVLAAHRRFGLRLRDEIARRTVGHARAGPRPRLTYRRSRRPTSSASCFTSSAAGISRPRPAAWPAQSELHWPSSWRSGATRPIWVGKGAA